MNNNFQLMSHFFKSFRVEWNQIFNSLRIRIPFTNIVDVNRLLFSIISNLQAQVSIVTLDFQYFSDLYSYHVFYLRIIQLTLYQRGSKFINNIIFKYRMNQPASNQNETQTQAVIIQQKITKTNGQIVVKRYTRGKALGRGGFAKCYQVTSQQNKKVLAAKIIAKSSLNRSRAKQKLITEIKIHKSLNHNHIVKFEHVFQDHENVYILLEICTNHTLNELIKRRKRLTQMQVQYYLVQIVSALKYLHANKVIHRDLKLGNLFLNQNMEIKLGDFGLATRLQYNEQKKKTICGTPNYIAPQILQGKGHSYEVDIWSVGVIIYTQLIGKPPFETPQVKATYKKIKQCQYSFPDHVTISEKAKNLISKILVLDPSKRPTLDEILEDPFMTTEPIPKTIPRSTLACPPAKNFTDQYKPAGKKQSSKEKLNKNESEVQFKKQTEEIGKKQSTKPSLKNTQSSKKSHSQIHVKKWVDYSTKYGLGYLLSDGSTGVYFNDSTKIIVDKAGEQFEYIEKKQGDKLDSVTKYNMKEYPQQRQLMKKVTLLQHFRNYLYADSNLGNQKDSNFQPGYVYVKKWMKTKHAIMFRLSNKIVQVNFTDKSEIILSSEQKLVTYINLKGERSEYPLATALDSKNAEMAKRLKYTKQILTHMLNGTTVPQSQMNEDIN